MIISIFLIITITFVLLHMIPGSPFAGEKVLPQATQEALNEKYHLNEPLYTQYKNYIKQIIKLELGASFNRAGFSVNNLMKTGFFTSAKVGIWTFLFVFFVGVPIGIVSALKENQWQDKLFTFLATISIAIPNFVLGTLIIYFLGVKLHLIPTFGLSGWKSYIGPVITLGGFSIAYVFRLMRSGMLEVLNQDYIRTARAKGLSEIHIIGKHAIKNALLPIVTYLGPLTAVLLTGSFVIEKIFTIPGMGSMFVESVSNRDYTVVMGATIFYAFLLLIMTWIVDILYCIVDPRIKLHK